ncbi:MAG: keto-deoxy-phosphogluconate aldolase, partial [Pseudonocardia sediminis]
MTTTAPSRPISGSLLDLAPVVPVVVISDPATAVPLARALVAGGLPVIEVTLRTAAALEATRRIAQEVPDAVVGVGTVRTTLQVREAHSAGAGFLVSPGATPSLLDAMDESGLPYLPGVSTISEMLTVAERGVTEMKFFPAEAAGGR